ncbi:MAG TPA: MBL fold metallo-hydrolase [Vicinamibacterales bacterium]|jgi:L-ascorbate metabolism protein UlaG (beta-lactamase superfamily)|nr:MBL fold metallo-hydrolase [Vicinamibacterales bacterium]
MLVNQPEQRTSVAIITRLAFVAACLATAEASPEHVQLKYLGTAGWEISDGRTVVLIDPYLSRLRMRIPNDDALADDPRRLFTRDDVAESDVATIDAHIRRADFILITHTHADHAMDLPYIAKKTGAIVIGTESSRNVARAYGIANDKLIVGRGGDDLEFDSMSVRIIPSLHGILRRAPFLARDPSAPPPPMVVPVDAKAPMRIADFAEGGTLAYLIRIGGRQILVFGSMNYIEREVEGLRPDVALIGAMPERREIHEYMSRLLRAIGYPRMVLPTHWDRFNVTYDVSQAPALERLQSFIAEVKAASPKTDVRIPKYFEAIEIP